MKTNMREDESPWFHDWIYSSTLPQLTREQFIAKYFPRYVADYRPRTGIWLRPDGRPMRTTRGTIQAQETRRTNTIDAAFSRYQRDYAANYKTPPSTEGFWGGGMNEAGA